MELGIAGKKALVCAASKGLGKGCAQALAAEGAQVTILARQEEGLKQTVAEIQAHTGVSVQMVVADITTEEGREAALGACPAPDILVNNAGGPPPGDFRDWRQQHWFEAVNGNMYSPIDMIRRTLDGMLDRGFGRIINITSAAVKQPIAALGLSNGARSGLTGFVAGISRDIARHNVTINNLLPGLFDTERGRGAAALIGGGSGLSGEEYIDTLPAGRLGMIEEFGATCAFLCSQQAAYITGQNILVDGGNYRGTF
ncbi:MAG: SDR family oxidoreductase [Gammaproteobacteria bacterium]|nr:MAG: SDR family oxidoreductase [Gammaproteobacteria bacterium]